MAVQVKRLGTKKSRHTQLRQHVGANMQIDLLKRYAKHKNAVPMYALYNYTHCSTYKGIWHCGRSEDCRQLGVTLANVSVMGAAARKGASKKFDAIHKSKSVLPLRCIAGWLRFRAGWGEGNEEGVIATDRNYPASLLDFLGEDWRIHKRLSPENRYGGRWLRDIEDDSFF